LADGRAPSTSENRNNSDMLTKARIREGSVPSSLKYEAI